MVDHGMVNPVARQLLNHGIYCQPCNIMADKEIQ